MMQFAPGLGLLGGVIIDQHFGARGRSGRLLTAVAHNPDLLGIGLDEDTAIEVQHSGALTVVGSGSVMIVDGIDISHTNIHQVAEQTPIAMCGLRIHMLTHGYGYHTQTRIPQLPAAGAPVPAETGTTANEEL
jgi:cyanophycinase